MPMISPTPQPRTFFTLALIKSTVPLRLNIPQTSRDASAPPATWSCHTGSGAVLQLKRGIVRGRALKMIAFRPLPGSTCRRPVHSIQTYGPDLVLALKRRLTVFGTLTKFDG